MDFIERLFGFAPDGGSGATEALLMIGALLLLLTLRRGRLRRAAQRIRRQG